MWVELLLGAGALGVTASGWIFAYRARGESRAALIDLNRAFDRERAAGVDRDRANTKTMEATATAANADIQRVAALAENRALRSELDIMRRERVVLYERLATAGVAVGDVLFDLAVAGLYPDASRGSPGTGGGEDPLSRHDDDPAGVPADVADPAKPPRES